MFDRIRAIFRPAPVAEPPAALPPYRAELMPPASELEAYAATAPAEWEVALAEYVADDEPGSLALAELRAWAGATI